jgi:ketosteroid isomerase-like protein
MGSPADFVHTVLTAMERYDAGTLRPLFQDDARLWPPPSAAIRGVARPVIGADAIVAMLTGALGYFEAGTIAYDVNHIAAGNGNVAVSCSRTSRMVNGQRYDNEYCLFFRLVDGRIAEMWEYVDTAHAGAQLRSLATDPTEDAP